MAASTLRHWLALYYCLPQASRHLQLLLRVFDSPQAVLAQSPEMFARQGLPDSFCTNLRSWQAGASSLHRQVEEDLLWQETASQLILVPDDPDYPELLRHIPDPPPVLFVQGRAECLYQLQLAIVGSRKPSTAGLAYARRFARFLSQQGMIITSGLAYGIDSEAHRAALTAGGRTIAVLGGGIEEIYPHRHESLAAQIKENGCLVSEFPRRFQPLPWCFPRRNRIVTGLSAGVLVVEARLRSGSLISACSALEQGREVFAIPGNIDNPRTEGCHSLIRQGAVLASRPEDIPEALAFAMTESQPGQTRAAVPNPVELSEPESLVMNVLEDIALPAEVLGRRAGIPPGQVLTILTRLELLDLVTLCPEGYGRKIADGIG